LLGAGCTTFKPIATNGPAVQERIYSGDLLHAGDEVRIVTSDGSMHEFRLTRIDADAGTVIAGNERIAIDDIVQVDKRAIAPAKSGGLVMAILMLLMGGGG
jgi:hypothetical protein